MRRKTFAATARDAHLAPAQMLQSLETLVRPGPVSAPSVCTMATGTK